MGAKMQLRSRSVEDEPRFVVGMDAHARKLAVSVWDPVTPIPTVGLIAINRILLAYNFASFVEKDLIIHIKNIPSRFL